MDERIRKRVQEHYDEVERLGYEVVLVALCGSQNYKLNIEGSDVDTKAIVLPKFEDVVLNRRPVSCTHVMENGEHVDIKDIRLMFGEFKKANINFVELLFTEYNIVNEKYAAALLPVFDNREKIARYNPIAALKCATGQAKCRWKEVQKEFNYKKCSNILRFEDFMISYIEGKGYLYCIVPEDLWFIRSVKSGTCDMSQEDLMKKCEYAVAHCELLLEAYEHFDKLSKCIPDVICFPTDERLYNMWVGKYVDKLLNGVISNILSDWLQEDIKNYKLN